MSIEIDRLIGVALVALAVWMARTSFASRRRALDDCDRLHREGRNGDAEAVAWLNIRSEEWRLVKAAIVTLCGGAYLALAPGTPTRLLSAGSLLAIVAINIYLSRATDVTRERVVDGRTPGQLLKVTPPKRAPEGNREVGP